MYIFIMRHGEAVNAHQNDKDRQLTAHGQLQSNNSAMWLADYCQSLGVEISLALVSPYVRAQQTFSIVNQRIGVDDHFNNSDIVPLGNAKVASDYINVLLAQRKNTQALLLVSHMPFVSYLLDELCNEHHSMLFSTGGIVCVDYDLDKTIGNLTMRYFPD